MSITYLELAETIAKMSPEQQNCDVTVFLLNRFTDSYYPAELGIAGDDGVLDKEHPILIVDLEKEADES